jgi:Rhodopirellula transposase DDE domain
MPLAPHQERSDRIMPHRAGGNHVRVNATVRWYKTGLKVVCELDDKLYPKGVVVSDEELAAVNIVRADFHGEWNYTIKPSHRSDRAVDS